MGAIFSNQDVFNKFVTTVIMLFMMGMFVYSTVMNRPIDLTNVLGLIGALLGTHGIHLFSNAFNQRTSSQVETAQIQANSTTNGKTS